MFFRYDRALINIFLEEKMIGSLSKPAIRHAPDPCFDREKEAYQKEIRRVFLALGRFEKGERYFSVNEFKKSKTFFENQGIRSPLFGRISAVMKTFLEEVPSHSEDPNTVRTFRDKGRILTVLFYFSLRNKESVDPEATARKIGDLVCGSNPFPFRLSELQILRNPVHFSHTLKKFLSDFFEILSDFPDTLFPKQLRLVGEKVRRANDLLYVHLLNGGLEPPHRSEYKRLRRVTLDLLDEFRINLGKVSLYE